MATRRTSFSKLQRDRAKQAAAAAKRERRVERANAEDVEIEIPTEGELSPAELLVLIEEIHRQFDAKLIDFEEFEEKKSELLARLPVD
jgi:FKBP-type peptidyl-prolyl cis-trans isomerase (trigger factor)